MTIKIYKVGGCVRDELIGVSPKDIDFAVVAPSFAEMREYVVDNLKGHIFIEKPEFFTIRARVDGETNDYVLCRKDGIYKDGRRPETVSPGTIEDDLGRRDATINAMAKTLDGDLIDPFGGLADLRSKLLRCVGDTDARFEEDRLRMLRMMRFSVTLGFTMHMDIEYALRDEMQVKKLMNSVSFDRIREEVHKMFSFDTLLALDLFERFPEMKRAVFDKSTGMRLFPSNRKDWNSKKPEVNHD